MATFGGYLGTRPRPRIRPLASPSAAARGRDPAWQLAEVTIDGCQAFAWKRLLRAATDSDEGEIMAKQATVLSESQTADAMLRARASRVVPGGMWGHLNAARLPE